MSLRDIPKFEKMNNLSVHVYGLTDTNKVQILKISNNDKNDETHIDLLYFTSKEKSHYAFIKNLSRLTKSQIKVCNKIPGESREELDFHPIDLKFEEDLYFRSLNSTSELFWRITWMKKVNNLGEISKFLNFHPIDLKFEEDLHIWSLNSTTNYF